MKYLKYFENNDIDLFDEDNWDEEDIIDHTITDINNTPIDVTLDEISNFLSSLNYKHQGDNHKLMSKSRIGSKYTKHKNKFFKGMYSWHFYAKDGMSPVLSLYAHSKENYYGVNLYFMPKLFYRFSLRDRKYKKYFREFLDNKQDEVFIRFFEKEKMQEFLEKNKFVGFKL